MWIMLKDETNGRGTQVSPDYKRQETADRQLKHWQRVATQVSLMTGHKIEAFICHSFGE